MSSLSSKIWKASGSAHLASRMLLLSRGRPYFPIRVARVPIKFYSSPTSQKPDEVILHKFKRIAALRQDLERCDGFQFLHNTWQHTDKLRREANKGKSIFKDKSIPTLASSIAWEFVVLEREYIKIVMEMCEKVNGEKLKEMNSQQPRCSSRIESTPWRSLNSTCALS